MNKQSTEFTSQEIQGLATLLQTSFMQQASGLFVMGCRPRTRYGAMHFAKKVVLHCPNGVPPSLHEVAGKFVAGGVKFVGAVGPKCDEVEEIIDEAVVLAGSPGRNFILTSSHPGESLQDAIDFAECLTGDYEGPVQVVELL